MTENPTPTPPEGDATAPEVQAPIEQAPIEQAPIEEPTPSEGQPEPDQEAATETVVEDAGLHIAQI